MNIFRSLINKFNRPDDALIRDYFIFKGCLTFLEGNNKKEILNKLYYNHKEINEKLVATINFNNKYLKTYKVTEIINESKAIKIIFDVIKLPLNYKEITDFYVTYDKFWVLFDVKNMNLRYYDLYENMTINLSYKISI